MVMIWFFRSVLEISGGFLKDVLAGRQQPVQASNRGRAPGGHPPFAALQKEDPKRPAEPPPHSPPPREALWGFCRSGLRPRMVFGFIPVCRCNKIFPLEMLNWYKNQEDKGKRASLMRFSQQRFRCIGKIFEDFFVRCDQLYVHALSQGDKFAVIC